MFDTSVLYEKTLESTADVIIHQGGTSSGKTYSILQVLFSKAIEERCVITIVGQDIPNLKAGALRDALNIVDSSPELKSLIQSYNKTDRIFEFASGSTMEFKSYQDAQDAKSGKRQYSFFNEANGIAHDIFEQINLRTTKQTYIDYNPDAEFWVHENLIGKPGVQLFISDHRHNPFVPEKIREKIEALKDKDIDLWKVYGRGMTGKIEGLIFRNYNIVEEVPSDAKLIGYGMDFGFTNDPSTALAVYTQDGQLFIDELFYETGLTNQDIAQKLESHSVSKQDDIIADSAEPKSIKEIYNCGFNIYGADKGPDSVKNSIDILKRFILNITRNSINTRKEIKNFKWATDNTGKTINKPVGVNDHAMSALRYLALNKLSESAKPSWGYTFA